MSPMISLCFIFLLTQKSVSLIQFIANMLWLQTVAFWMNCRRIWWIFPALVDVTIVIIRSYTNDQRLQTSPKLPPSKMNLSSDKERKKMPEVRTVGGLKSRHPTRLPQREEPVLAHNSPINCQRGFC